MWNSQHTDSIAPEHAIIDCDDDGSRVSKWFSHAMYKQERHTVDREIFAIKNFSPVA